MRAYGSQDFAFQSVGLSSKIVFRGPDLFREFIVYCPVLFEYNSPVNFIATLDSQKSEGFQGFFTIKINKNLVKNEHNWCMSVRKKYISAT